MSGMQMRLVDDVEAGRLKAAVNFSRMVASTDICTFFMAGMPGAAIWPRATVAKWTQRRSCLRGSLRSYLEAMKLDSKYFDSVRVRPDHDKAVSQEAPACQWKGCQADGAHRAPRGRGYEGQYYLFCLDHVRQFNASYNYFEGMSNAEVEAYQKDSVIGHRPTWKAGANAWAHGTRHGGSSAAAGGRAASDPHAFFSWRPAGRARREARRPASRWRQKALESAQSPGDRHAGRDQVAVQGAGQTPPPRRQRRRHTVRGQVARNHPSL